MQGIRKLSKILLLVCFICFIKITISIVKDEAQKKRRTNDAPSPLPAPPTPTSNNVTKTKTARNTSAGSRSTAKQVFGLASDEEDNEPSGSNGKKPVPSIVSYVTQKTAQGFSRTYYDNKPGKYFIELKVYKCDEIEKIQPMNRWRHSIITIKNRTNDDSEAWRKLTDFISSTKKEYKNCKKMLISNYY